jgi:hypothetical protein
MAHPTLSTVKSVYKKLYQTALKIANDSISGERPIYTGLPGHVVTALVRFSMLFRRSLSSVKCQRMTEYWVLAMVNKLARCTHTRAAVSTGVNK